MKRCLVLAVAIAIFLPGSATAQDERVTIFRAAVTGSRFTSYYAIPVSTFERLGDTPEQRIRALRRMIPNTVGNPRWFIQRETYLFFPLCGQSLHRYRPTVLTVWGDQRRIPIQCP